MSRLMKAQLFLSDTKTFFSKQYGWAAGMGDRKYVVEHSAR
jgi:hypothetical protein